MRFPLADWIDSHPGVRHDLARSGMVGAIRPPGPTPADRREADPELLRRRLAESLGVAPDRLFLTHGGTEANGWVLLYLARSMGGGPTRCRVALPEYPPLVDGPRAAGFEIATAGSPAELAIVSNPRNPEGVDWTVPRLEEWAQGTRQLLVDETFREFGDRPSLARLDRPGLWTTGSFTKFYAGDDLRVGFVVAPAAESARFARFHGLFADELPSGSVAGAIAAVREHGRIRADVDRIVGANRRALVRAFPGASAPVAPVWFDRTGPGSAALARRLLAASVLVCPGAFFGEPGGNRICLTRPTFPVDLAAYLSLRGPDRPGEVTGAGPRSSTVRPRRAGSSRGRAGRG